MLYCGVADSQSPRQFTFLGRIVKNHSKWPLERVSEVTFVSQSLSLRKLLASQNRGSSLTMSTIGRCPRGNARMGFPCTTVVF